MCGWVCANIVKSILHAATHVILIYSARSRFIAQPQRILPIGLRMRAIACEWEGLFRTALRGLNKATSKFFLMYKGNRHRLCYTSITTGPIFFFSIGSICPNQYSNKWKVKKNMVFEAFSILSIFLSLFCRCWTHFVLVSNQILSSRPISTVWQRENYVVSTIETRPKTWAIILLGRWSRCTRFTHCSR